jgi:hypothetical protein
MPGLFPGIHVLTSSDSKTWMAGSSPDMTKREFGFAKSIYGGRSRAAIQASARYAASITASNATTLRLPP